MDQDNQTDLQPHLPLLLFPLLCLALCLYSLSGCSSETTVQGQAQADQSDNSVRGDTSCSTTVKLNPETGECDFTKQCDGAEVSSGDFKPNSENECVVPPAVEGEPEAAEARPEPEPTISQGFDFQ